MWRFSNFTPAIVIVDGHEYATLEHAYQAMKTFDGELRTRIRNAATPAAAKRHGRAIPRHKLRKDWDKIKRDVMLELLRDKFHREPQRSMLAQSREQLIEITWWHDTYWGVCSCLAHGMQGENVLGQLLTQVREELWETA